MPVISRFFVIIVRMFTETDGQHHTPHVHVAYQDDNAVYSINPVDLMAGTIPQRQQRFIETWIELYQAE